MPSVKRRASKILNEYGEAQAELIGKAVAPTDGKAGTVENVWLVHSASAARCPERAPFRSFQSG
jgi:GMP synthase-like glutamine amidotransferase